MPETKEQQPTVDPASSAQSARAASLLLQSLPEAIRTDILQRLVTLVQSHSNAILHANQQDVDESEKDDNLSSALRARLRLTHSKLSSVCDGITYLSSCPPVIGCIQQSRELSDGLLLQQVSVPIGVLLVIFESRPDVYPQLVALSIKTGNGILMKGGKEAQHTLQAMHALTLQAISQAVQHTEYAHQADTLLHLVTLVSSRSSVLSLLSLSSGLDLVIPRGSQQLVEFIQQNTKIPVMGHAEGICHVYVDEHAQTDKAISIIIDSKCDYPAACNAVETILIHDYWLTHNQLHQTDVHAESVGSKECLVTQIIERLREAGVTCYAGPVLSPHFPLLQPLQSSFHHEYSALECTVELVPSLTAAIAHINQHSSHHTDSIVTESSSNAHEFVSVVDSACVFVNASTRFADGYRFGLGCEVGISTGRLHARGPVGMDGLCTYKWVLNSSTPEGHTVTQHTQGKWLYKWERRQSDRTHTSKVKV